MLVNRSLNLIPFFKEHRSGQNSECHVCWISPDSAFAVMIEFASNADRVGVYENLDSMADQLESSSPAEALEMLRYAAAGCGGVRGFCGVAAAERRVTWLREGHSVLLVMGSRGLESIEQGRGERPTVAGEFFLMVQASTQQVQLVSALKDLEIGSPAAVQEMLDTLIAGSWQGLVFPVESSLGYQNPDWPYDPFIGFQESQPHERLGLRLLADALFARKEFNGFRIAGGHHVALQRGSRLLDGILVSPWGVFLLELKHVSGAITLETQNRNSGMRIENARGIRVETNPVFKIEESLRQTVANFDFGAEIALPQRQYGILLFSHPRASVRCIDPAQKARGIPQRCGNVLIGTPASIAAQILDLHRELAKGRGGSLTAPLDSTTIRKVAHRLGGNLERIESPETALKRWGGS